MKCFLFLAAFEQTFHSIFTPKAVLVFPVGEFQLLHYLWFFVGIAWASQK